MKNNDILSITAPVPGWIRLRKINDHAHMVDIDPKNEMHQVIKKNLLRSGYWEQVPAE